MLKLPSTPNRTGIEGFPFAEMRHKVVETSTNGYEDPLIDGFDHFDIRSETERPHTLDVRQWY